MSYAATATPLKTVLRDVRLHALGPVHTLQGAAANNTIRTKDAAPETDFRRKGNAECGSPPVWVVAAPPAITALPAFLRDTSCLVLSQRCRSFPADRGEALALRG
jgi:hypothetical protein